MPQKLQNSKVAGEEKFPEGQWCAQASARSSRSTPSPSAVVGMLMRQDALVVAESVRVVKGTRKGSAEGVPSKNISKVDQWRFSLPDERLSIDGSIDG